VPRPRQVQTLVRPQAALSIHLGTRFSTGPNRLCLLPRAYSTAAQNGVSTTIYLKRSPREGASVSAGGKPSELPYYYNL
jgi:hypothetical protein